MELKIDPSKTYAIALEGGGAKGAYQIGVWKALEEAGIRYNAVSGSSVGALNGAMMAMRKQKEAEEIWSTIRFSQVMNADDELLRKAFQKKLSFSDMIELGKYVIDTMKAGGIDVTPLRNWLKNLVDEETIRSSDVDLYIMTYSVTDKKELDIDVKTLPEGSIHELLLASAQFPLFRQEKIQDKLLTDGGVQDLVPISSLIQRDYKDIIVIRIYGVGIEKRVKIPKDVHLYTIAPKEDLGSVLHFDKDSCKQNITLGYYDGKRFLYGLYGERYYIHRTMTEKLAYQLLKREKSPTESLRVFHEKTLSGLARKSGVKGDYYDLFLTLLEKRAEKEKIERFCIYTDRELYGLLKEKGIF